MVTAYQRRACVSRGHFLRVWPEIPAINHVVALEPLTTLGLVECYGRDVAFVGTQPHPCESVVAREVENGPQQPGADSPPTPRGGRLDLVQKHLVAPVGPDLPVAPGPADDFAIFGRDKRDGRGV